jgi:DNA modification methylase
LITPSLWPEAAPTTGLARPGSPEQAPALAEIERLDLQLLQRFQSRVLPDPSLTRPLVSFQANKNKAGYRWYKFKEAFSAPLIEHLLVRYGVTAGRLLDPFAGSGTALFVGAGNGLDADGIEVLPIGQQLIEARRIFESGLRRNEIVTLRKWAEEKVWERCSRWQALPELRITQGAYSPETKTGIERFLTQLGKEEERIQILLRFALLCVLESVSYTRKDGQYLRWDHRSGRKQGSKIFDKGKIAPFNAAISAKIGEIIFDLEGAERSTELFPSQGKRGKIKLYAGSCLELMQSLPSECYSVTVTSPPYCNRYDYTRTYALELALLGISEKELINLRQQMLSCTVENRAKDLLQINPRWNSAIEAADGQTVLQKILCYLDQQKEHGALNNTGIPRMVRGYFYEMACVIAECARVLKTGARVLMVNDNVRYAGASISVDLILSDMAEQLGFQMENILVLPGGKGNSSQQMGHHGREALRKCVYVWRRI